MTAALRLGGRHSGRHGCLRDPLRPRHRVLHWIQLQHALPRRPVDPRAPLRHRHVSAPAAAGLVAASTCERARRSRTRCRHRHVSAPAAAGLVAVCRHALAGLCVYSVFTRAQLFNLHQKPWLPRRWRQDSRGRSRCSHFFCYSVLPHDALFLKKNSQRVRRGSFRTGIDRVRSVFLVSNSYPNVTFLVVDL